MLIVKLILWQSDLNETFPVPLGALLPDSDVDGRIHLMGPRTECWLDPFPSAPGNSCGGNTDFAHNYNDWGFTITII